jgi:hypothetical protein
MRQLHEGPFKHLSPTGLKPKHIKWLMQKWEAEGLLPSTLQSRLSHLSFLCHAAGKGEIIKKIGTYLADKNNGKRDYVAKRDKSWTPAGVNIGKKIAEVTAYDVYVGIQLALCHAFGLRRKEAVMF